MFDELWVGVIPLLAWRVIDGVATIQAVDDLLAETANRLPAGAVVHREEQDDETTGREAADVAKALD